MAEPSKDVMIAVLGASGALAGLLLIFVGFVYSHAETFETKRRDRYRYVAKAGLLPFLLSLISTWLSLDWLTGHAKMYEAALFLFKVDIILSGIYGAVALLLYL